jgi:hypothetical protein
MEKYFDTSNYMNFDFNKLYEDQINNASREQLLQKLLEFVQQP